MNKAVPWNINGVGFDAREAARDAARRQGKSLGTWLQGVIADHAADLGVEAREMAGRERVDAVATRLERLNARSTDHDRRARGARARDAARPRALRDRDQDFDDRPSRIYQDRDDVEDTDLLLEDAIDAMERRTRRAERHTDAAIESFSRLLERSEVQRDRERDSVSALAEKLTDVEARLSEYMGRSDDNPIKGALARLETRLDSIGRRSAAEASVRQRVAGTEDPLHRFEEKLNAILDAVHSKRPHSTSEASPIALDAARAARGPGLDRRRLGDAIADITRRQHALDEPSGQPVSLSQAVLRRRDEGAPGRRPDTNADASFQAMKDDIADLAATIEGLRRDTMRQQPKDGAGDVSALREEVAAMSRMLRDFGPNGGLGSLETSIRTLTQCITAAREDRAPEPTLDQRLAAAPAVDADAKSDAAGVLESQLRELAERIEAAQSPGAGSATLDALQQQIGLLSTRFERSDEGLAKLTSLERSMQNMFAHLEETRARVETSASQAAREALRTAIDEGAASHSHSAASNLATLRALHEEAEARTEATLSAVHSTLEKVVDRLAAVETDAAARSRPAPKQDFADRPRLDDGFPSLGIADAGLVQSPKVSQAARRGEERIREPALDLDQGLGRSDFIAAARRAAKVAQADTSGASPSRAGKLDDTVREGLIEQSRDYVAKHKRPVLLSIAALFVVLGTMAIVQGMGFGDGDNSRVVEAAAPVARVASVAVPSPRPSAGSTEVLSPSALPKSARPLAAAIPGSDPIQTGSIPSLPSFAAAGAGHAAPRQALPARLKTMADAGDGAAEYVLGTQYAEGQLVPRDFAQAAKWYQKAAAQSLAPAQYRLASLYEKGLGVAQDKAKARALYLQAAEAGNPRAMHNLAVLLADGSGKPDYEGAATWFRKAAQYGVRDSQYNLAILLARGVGQQQSLVQSYQWFAIAAAQGDEDAGRKRDEVATKLAANDLAVAKALANSFKPRTADVVATEVQPPVGGWDGASAPASLNSAGSKVSSL